MLLKDYVASLERLLSSTPFVTGTSLSYEERPPTAGLVKATITFSDGSQLDLREFLILEPEVQTLKYAYNYRKAERLIFRYDNANDPAAGKLSSFPCHKHSSERIIETEKPSLEEVLQEIVSHLHFP
jgi:hypothetical protein